MAKDGRSLWRNGGVVAVIVGLMAAVSLLPPDTSLDELQKGGVLRACVPQDNAPLVMAEGAEMRGIDVEILQTLADELGVRLILNRNAAIGRELDPRTWLISRASCHIIGGGIVTGDVMSSFMQLTAPHLHSGWTVITPDPALETLEGQRVGVYVGMIGRDRIALSRLLRAQGAEIALVDTDRALAEGIAAGRFTAGVADTVLAGPIAAKGGWHVVWLDEESNAALAFGLWKGDMTLSRRVEGILDAMRADGRMDAIIARYDLIAPERALVPPMPEED